MISIREEFENLPNKRQRKRCIRLCEVEFTVDNLTLKGISSDFSIALLDPCASERFLIFYTSG